MNVVRQLADCPTAHYMYTVASSSAVVMTLCGAAAGRLDEI